MTWVYDWPGYMTMTFWLYMYNYNLPIVSLWTGYMTDIPVIYV